MEASTTRANDDRPHPRLAPRAEDRGASVLASARARVRVCLRVSVCVTAGH